MGLARRRWTWSSLADQSDVHLRWANIVWNLDCSSRPDSRLTAASTTHHTRIHPASTLHYMFTDTSLRTPFTRPSTRHSGSIMSGSMRTINTLPAMSSWPRRSERRHGADYSRISTDSAASMITQCSQTSSFTTAATFCTSPTRREIHPRGPSPIALDAPLVFLLHAVSDARDLLMTTRTRPRLSQRTSRSPQPPTLLPSLMLLLISVEMLTMTTVTSSSATSTSARTAPLRRPNRSVSPLRPPSQVPAAPLCHG